MQAPVVGLSRDEITETINRIVWSRDRAEKTRSFGVWDGTPIEYRLEVAVEPGQWHLVASSSDHPPAPNYLEWVAGADFAGGIPPTRIERLVKPLIELEATNAMRTPPEYRSDHWGEENEILQSTIQSICQTPDGYLWISAEQGLVRFDGDQFKTFNLKDGLAWDPGAGTGLLLNPGGGLLIPLEPGSNNLALYDRGRFRRFDLGGNSVRWLFHDRERQLWGLTAQGTFPWKGDPFDVAEGSATRGPNIWLTQNNWIGKFVQNRFVPLSGREGRPLEFGAGSNRPVLLLRPDGLTWVLEGGGMGELLSVPGQGTRLHLSVPLTPRPALALRDPRRGPGDLN